MTADTYNQVFTLHGAIMVFLFIIPSIPAALGNFVLPIMLGAKDVAFPEAQPAELLHLLVGAVMALTASSSAASIPAGPSTRPTRTTTGGAVSADDAGAFILGFSSIFTGLNFIVTIHKLRAPGHGLVPHAAVRLGASTRPPSSRSWRRRCSAITLLLLDGARLPHRHLRSRSSAATRCSSSTSSGSTPTRPSTS